MGLTEEQKERIRKNKERALEIRRRKAEEARKKEKDDKKRQKEEEKGGSGKLQQQSNNETTISVTNTESTTTQTNINNDKKRNTKIEPIDNEEVELEVFEIDASPYVTKTEAMKTYCLPEGTIAVCAYIEKDNPRQSQWNKMKLYHRNEIRKWSRERWGSLEGLVEERRRRELKRFERDFDEVQDIFSSKKKRRK